MTRITPKRRTKTYSNPEELRVALVAHCEKEYAETFGHPWAKNPLRGIDNDLRRSKIEAEAWAVMNKLGKAAGAAVSFFEDRGLELHRPDHGLYNAYKLHLLVQKRRRLLESLKEEVGKYRRPLETRKWLAWRVNVSSPNAFAGLPYKRKLNNRELAVITVMKTEGRELTFKKGMTVSDAIDQETRRMARAAERAIVSRKSKK